MNAFDELSPSDKMMVDGLYWWGPATLFRCPHDPDPAACEIALVGVPHSAGNGSTEHDQHLGPRAVRNVSALQRRYHAVFDIDPWATCRIHDLGDVPLPELNDNEASVRRITSAFTRIANARARPVSIGGDHAITGAIVRGLATAGRPVGLVHLDAHIDAYDSIPHWMGSRDSAAHWAAYLVREGLVDPARSIQIGMRGNPRNATWLDPSYELGYEVVTMERYRELGAAVCARMIRERVGDGPVYVTFDLDCLDATVAPAVSNLEPAFTGWNVDEAFALVRALRGCDIIGGDVVCLMPTKDSPNQITAMVAAAAAFELVGLIADRLRQTRGR